MNVKPIDQLIKKEDDTKTFQIQLLDDSNSPFVLAEGVLELDIEYAKDEIIERQVNVIDAQTGIIEIDLSGIETGSYNCEIILRNGEEIMTFPTNGYFMVQVNKNLIKE